MGGERVVGFHHRCLYHSTATSRCRAPLCDLINPTIMGSYLLIALKVSTFTGMKPSPRCASRTTRRFLRGNLTVYPIVIKQVPVPDDGALLPCLVEKPIELRPLV
jgi:hypothetical protein